MGNVGKVARVEFTWTILKMFKLVCIVYIQHCLVSRTTTKSEKIHCVYERKKRISGPIWMILFLGHSDLAFLFDIIKSNYWFLSIFIVKRASLEPGLTRVKNRAKIVVSKKYKKSFYKMFFLISLQNFKHIDQH